MLCITHSTVHDALNTATPIRTKSWLQFLKFHLRTLCTSSTNVTGVGSVTAQLLGLQSSNKLLTKALLSCRASSQTINTAFVLTLAIYCCSLCDIVNSLYCLKNFTIHYHGQSKHCVLIPVACPESRYVITIKNCTIIMVKH